MLIDCVNLTFRKMSVVTFSINFKSFIYYDFIKLCENMSYTVFNSIEGD